MKIVIDANDLVDTEVAVRMALQVLDREDGELKFSGGYAMEIRTAKTQKSFKVTLRSDSDTLAN